MLRDGVEVAASLGDDAIDLAKTAGLALDPWQCQTMRDMAAVRDATYYNPYLKRHQPRWAAKDFGIVLARQNGKGSLIEARELAGLFLWGERLIIHSAHQFNTSLEAFNRLLILIENTPDLEAEVQRVIRNHGEEGIDLIKPKSSQLEPQRIRFRTRTKASSRGLTADTLILDEAMLGLTTQEASAMLPTTSARPNPQVLYTGSAGTEESEQFGLMRGRALKAIAGTVDEPRLGWNEWSVQLCGYSCPSDCDEHFTRDDPRAWALANPSIGYRMTEEVIFDELRGMTHDGFNRERLSIGTWPTDGEGWRVIPRDAWEIRCNEMSALSGKYCIAIDTAPDSSYTSISAAGPGENEQIHGEITGTTTGFDHRQGIRWAVNRVVDIWRINKPAFVVINPATPAGRLVDQLESKGVKVVTVTTREYAQACGDLKYAVAPRAGEKAEFTHLGQAPLNIAVANASARQIQELWSWDKAESAADITPLTAMTLAFYGYKKHLYKKTSAPWFYRG